MTASATDLVEFVAGFEADTLARNVGLHPAGRATIHHWFGAMRAAAEDGDAGEVARLSAMIESKIALERQWCCDG